MNERVRLARNALNLKQADFGERLGVTATAISRIESGERGLTEQMLLAICREFNVNEEWLRTGEGAMLVKNNGAILAELTTKYKLSDIEQKIFEAYLQLSPVRREVVSNFVDSLSKTIDGERVEDFFCGVLSEISDMSLESNTHNTLVENVKAVRSEVFDWADEETGENYSRLADPKKSTEIAEELTPPTVSPRSSASVEPEPHNRQLTAHEQAELLRARADAIEKGVAYSTTLEKRGADGSKQA